jgi:serine/threonine protein kinase
VTTEGQIIGDLRYMAPERTGGEPSAGDHRADLYSLGAIVYAVLTGRPPIEGNNPVDFVRKIRDVVPTPVRKLVPQIPPALDSAVMRLLSKDPDIRFPDATELLRYIVLQRLSE